MVLLQRFIAPRPLPRCAAVLLGLLVSGAGTGHAQGIRAPTIWVEPSLSVGVSLSNNGRQSGSDPKAEQTLDVRPGLQVVMNGARVKGFVDYSVGGFYYAQGTSGDNVRQALNANARADLWDNRAFLDLSGVISDQAISAFGNGLNLGNRSETANFRLSPSVRGELAGWADYELRYSYQTTRSEATTRSDRNQQDLALRLARRPAGQALGWSVDAALQASDYSQGNDPESSSLRAGLVYAITPQLVATLSAGAESNDVLTTQRKSYSNAGLDLEWRPSPRARLSAGLEDRYFGHGHHLTYEYRTGRTVWRYTDTRGVSNSGTQSSTASLGSIYNLLDALYTDIQPDPVLRAQLVQTELLKLGLPADTEVFQSFLTSSATVNRAQALSLALVFKRSVVTFALSRNDARRLDAVINLGDDFDSNSRILQQGWSVNVAHRLTPLTSVSAALSSQKNTGSQANARTQTNALTLGLSTRLGLRTSGSLQLRRTVQDSTSSPYGETAIAGAVNHRF